MLIVKNEDVDDGTHTVSAEVFTQDREDCLTVLLARHLDRGP